MSLNLFYWRDLHINCFGVQVLVDIGTEIPEKFIIKARMRAARD